ncbi:uncharacterized protein PAC_10157 [Phialocephala subalpina]|uniref:Ubiquitin-like protease family profile domain-containing protein n=1 Tax=Phialocephala subalpina TaxID=576137 RepID=A0A1L7X5H3_9HELO|nr:uncharacterized protein PAC_10157 [Phialocephala subalpina]
MHNLPMPGKSPGTRKRQRHIDNTPRDSPSDVSAPVAVIPPGQPSGEERKARQKAPRIHGSYAPVNTLARANQPSTVQRSAFMKPGRFDYLHGTYSQRKQSNKRQKISGECLGSNVSSDNDIDPEEFEATTSQTSPYAAATRSVLSQSHDGSRRNDRLGRKGVEEFRGLERQVKPRTQHARRDRPGKLSRTDNTATGQRSNAHNSNSPSNQIDNPRRLKYTVVRIDDDPEDPVSDGDVEEVIIQPQKIGKSFPQVIINQPDYQESACRTPVQPQATVRISPHATSRNRQEGRTSIKSQSDHSMESLRETSRQSATSRKELPLKRKRRDPVDVSEDELAISNEPLRNVMQSVAKKGFSSVSTRPNIKGTKFRLSKKAKEDHHVEKYQVSSIFSESHCWLRSEDRESWVLHQHHSNGTLTPYDEEEMLVGELVLKPQNIQKIQRSPQSQKLVIHKHKNSTARGSTKLFLELHTVDDARLLCKLLKEHDSTISLIELERAQLDQHFLHNRNLLKSMAQKQSLSKAESKTQPDDIQLLEAKPAETRQQENIKQRDATKSFGDYRISDQSHGEDSFAPPKRNSLGDDFVPPPKRKMLKASMKPRSSDSSDIDNSLAIFKTLSSSESSSSYGDRTRSSSRLVDKEPGFEQPLKPRSPSPERWSRVNPNWAQDWRSSIIYPSAGKKKGKSIVDKSDIERLDEGEFLNDNIINFYLCWLEHHLEQENPELAKRIYFQNTFFYKRLTQTAKGKRGINFEAVERWTSKVDLLSFDYIIVPINELSHWYVAIICNASGLLCLDPDVIESSQAQEDDGGSTHPPGEVDVAKESPRTTPPSLNIPTVENNEPKESRVAGVDAAMEGMCLEGKEKYVEEGDGGDGRLNDHLEPKQRMSSPAWHDKWEGRKAFESTARVKSDWPKSHSAKPPPEKRNGRVSNTPVPRKYDQMRPRIITLDSLGLKHSPTCTNLKHYLVAEIKSKKKIDISPPRSLGMTAVNIPQQTNYVDCGVFLLSYIEEFLKRPDDLVHKIMQGQKLGIEFQKAPDMRNYIREILLKRQKDQVAEAEKSEKSENTRSTKAETKLEPSLPAHLTSYEASKGARTAASPDESRPDGQSFLAEIHQAQNTTKQSAAGQPAISEQSNGSKAKNALSVDDSSQDTGSSRDSGRSLLGSIKNLVPTFRYQDKVEGQSNTLLGRKPNPNAVEI